MRPGEGNFVPINTSPQPPVEPAGVTTTTATTTTTTTTTVADAGHGVPPSHGQSGLLNSHDNEDAALEGHTVYHHTAEDEDVDMDAGSEEDYSAHHPFETQQLGFEDDEFHTSDEDDMLGPGGAPLQPPMFWLDGTTGQYMTSEAENPPDDMLPPGETDWDDMVWNGAPYLTDANQPPHNPDVDQEDFDDDDGLDFEEGDMMDGDEPFPDAAFAFIASAAHHTLNPGNYGLQLFLQYWAEQGRGRSKGRFPNPLKINEQVGTRGTDHITYDDLEGDNFDIQGINWADMGVTRSAARAHRSLTYKNYVNKQGSDEWEHTLRCTLRPHTESFFRFKHMDIRRNIHLAHFQLRNVLASSSRDRVFYPGNGAVYQMNPLTGESKIALRFESSPQVQVTSLAAGYGVLVAGSFNGRYCIRNLNSDYIGGGRELHEGAVSPDTSGITNHVQLHVPRRSATPHAAFASNDLTFRSLDLATEQFVHESKFRFALNCTAVSPDGRLRVMVGDHTSVFIAAAEPERSSSSGEPEILQQLEGHRDFGFACDWADDGYTVATGFQDRFVKIWDARRWKNSSGESTPLTTLRTELAGARCLRFSPLGSGKRVLVAAEEADNVNIIDAQTFRSKQTIDFFGELGGVTFADAGRELLVLSCDRWKGGLARFERCGDGFEAAPLSTELLESDADEGCSRSRRKAGAVMMDVRSDTGSEWDWPVPAGEKAACASAVRARAIHSRQRVRNAAVRHLEPF